VNETLRIQVGQLARRSVLRTLRQPAQIVPALVFPLFLLAVNSGGLQDATNLPGGFRRHRALFDRTTFQRARPLFTALKEIARIHDATPSQVALAWLLANPVVTSPIIGATSLEQLDEDLGALDVDLTEKERIVLNEMTAWEER